VLKEDWYVICHCVHGGEEYAYRMLVGKPEGKRLRGRHRLRWEDDVKMNLKEMGWDGMDWIHLAEGRDKWQAAVNTVMNVWLT
jgi:hypothetical protein